MKRKSLPKILAILLSILLGACTPYETSASVQRTPAVSSLPVQTTASAESTFSLSDIPYYTNSPSVEINGNIPFFTSEDLAAAEQSYKSFSPLDDLGRCGPALASIGPDLLPGEPRGSIGRIKPSGWHTVRYDDLIEDKYLYNRCHLIAYELCGENANERNLITGTRYMNVMGMLPYENMTADFIKKSNCHVLYRSTPVFNGVNLVASGVLLEAESVEDGGEGLQFCVYCYNVQPGIEINYADGSSSRSTITPSPSEFLYIGNANTRKFHKPECPSVSDMAEHNKVYFTAREDAVNAGYTPCARCNP